MYTKQVRQFTVACETTLPSKPILMQKEQIAFLKQMVQDEMNELEAASNEMEQADALVDAIYYICNSAVKHGMNLDPLFEIVHRANMQKIIDGKVRHRNDGKILKPKGWQDPGPLLQKEICRQQQYGSFGTETSEDAS